MWWSFIAGLFVGANLGVAALSIFIVGARGEQR